MILVTGGTGLVGSHLLYHLAKEYDTITAIYRSEDKIEKVKTVFSFYENDFTSLFEKIIWIKADITDVTSLDAVFSSNFNHVYHCAALVSFNTKDYLKMRKINIEGTANIVNFCIENKTTKLCYVSSIATLGASINNKPISEENERNESQDENGYSITKYGAETEVWRASQEGVAVVIVNPGVILGSGFFNEGPGKMFTQVYNGLKFYTEGITGFIGVKDVVKIMIRLTKSDIKNERFILVSENKSFKEILFSIAKNFNKKSPHIKISALVIGFVWRANWLFSKITGKEPVLTKNTAKSSQRKTYYNNQKIKEQLNFNFEPIKNVIKIVCTNF